MGGDQDEEDSHDILDVLSAKAIVVGADLESLGESDKCQAHFNKW